MLRMKILFHVDVVLDGIAFGSVAGLVNAKTDPRSTALGNAARDVIDALHGPAIRTHFDFPLLFGINDPHGIITC